MCWNHPKLSPLPLPSIEKLSSLVPDNLGTAALDYLLQVPFRLWLQILQFSICIFIPSPRPQSTKPLQFRYVPQKITFRVFSFLVQSSTSSPGQVRPFYVSKTPRIYWRNAGFPGPKKERGQDKERGRREEKNTPHKKGEEWVTRAGMMTTSMGWEWDGGR